MPILVLTMYEKSAGKGARHAWTSKTTSIGALSYIAVKCYQHTCNRQFRPMECVGTRTTYFSHLPSLAFLCVVPQSAVQHFPSSHFLELKPGPSYDIFHGLLSEKGAVLVAIKDLLRPARKRRVEPGAAFKLVEDGDE
jgi:hypothetical protein